MSRQKEKFLKRELRKQKYAKEGQDSQRGFFTFGLILIFLGLGYGYICKEANAPDLGVYMMYPVGIGLLLILVGNLINKTHQTRIQHYDEYIQRKKDNKRI